MTTIAQPAEIKSVITQPNIINSVLTTAPVITSTLVVGQGPAGVGGGSYQHTQSIASAEWIVAHNLGFRPNVQAYSVGGMQMLAEVIHIDLNQARVYFDSPVAGYAICS